MKTTADFLDDLRAKLGLSSDNKLAVAMGWKRQHLSPFRQNRATFSDETAVKIARLLEVAPDYIMACMAAQRSKTPETRSAWERIARKVAAAVLLCAGLSGLLHNQNVRANPSSPLPGPIYTYAAIRDRRRRGGTGWRLGAALALSRLLRALMVAAALIAPSASWAADWTPADTGWELAFQGMLALDCLQTWKGSGADPQHFSEGNGVLPPHPSKGEIVALCAGVSLAHYGVSSFIVSDGPGPGKAFWQIGTVLIEAGVVVSNHAAGVTLRGSF
jgi:plasmid maintenance system antidote protein VapI